MELIYKKQILKSDFFQIQKPEVEKIAGDESESKVKIITLTDLIQQLEKGEIETAEVLSSKLFEYLDAFVKIGKTNKQYLGLNI